jgi:hypothetical protein
MTGRQKGNDGPEKGRVPVSRGPWASPDPNVESSPLGHGVFYTYFYNHVHRLRLEKLLHLELSKSSSGYFKPLLDPGGGYM